MSERRDENWLDDELRRAIDTTNPEFDAEAWKRKHAQAYQTLVARGRKRPGFDRKVRLVIGRLAAAAVILIGISILLTRTQEQGGHEPVPAPGPVVTSPAQMTSMMALRTAYRQGGQEALNRQLDTAMEKLGPRPSETPTLRLLSDFEG